MKNIQKQYQDLLEGKMSKANFMRNVRMQFPQHISPVTSYDDSVKILKGKRILSEVKQPEGVYKHNPNAEDDLYRGIDHLNKYVVDRAIKFELAQMPEITDENYVKARKKVVSKMLKDPDAYKELQIANYKDIKKRDENLKMKEYKKVGNVDKANEMKVVKKDAPASANHVAKEAKKKEKVAQMTQAPKGKLEAFPTPGKEKVMALKEHILDELMAPNPHKEEINKGSRVKKKGLKDYDAAQVGNVIEFDGDTAIVIWDKDKKAYEKAKEKWNTSGEGEDPDVTFGHHIQGNVLTKKDLPKDPEAAKQWDSLPNLGSVKGPDTGVSPKLTQMQEVDKENKMKRLKEKLMKAVNKLKNEATKYQIGSTNIDSEYRKGNDLGLEDELEKAGIPFKKMNVS